MGDKQLSNCQILWHIDYWDGPLSGILLCNNKIHYFDLAEEFELKGVGESDENGEYEDYSSGEYRKYNVYSLSPDDILRHSLMHSLWQICVGFHTDYLVPDGRNMQRAAMTAKQEEKQENQTIPVLHYGCFLNELFPFKGGWERWETLRKNLIKQYEQFNKENATLVGWIYYRQLWGRDIEETDNV